MKKEKRRAKAATVLNILIIAWAFLGPLYGTVYLTNILVNGTGVWPDTNDFYPFFSYFAAMTV